jgi:hypothetical protein
LVALSLTDKNQDIAPTGKQDVQHSKPLINQICCQTQHKRIARIGCSGSQHYCNLTPRIDHCTTTSCLPSKTRIRHQEQLEMFGSHSQIIKQTASSLPTGSSSLDSIIIIDDSSPRRTCYSLINVDHLDAEANIVHSCLSIRWLSETLSHSHANSA